MFLKGALEKTCKNALRLEEISDSEIYSIGGLLLDREEIANPCGLIAKSFFNGYYLLFFTI